MGKHPDFNKILHYEVLEIIDTVKINMYPDFAHHLREQRRLEKSKGITKIYALSIIWAYKRGSNSVQKCCKKLPPFFINSDLKRASELYQLLNEQLACPPDEWYDTLKLDRQAIEQMFDEVERVTAEAEIRFPGHIVKVEHAPHGFVMIDIVATAIACTLIGGLAYIFSGNPQIVKIISYLPCELLPSLKALAQVSKYPEMTLLMVSLSFYVSILFGIYRVFNMPPAFRIKQGWEQEPYAIIGGAILGACLIAKEPVTALLLIIFEKSLIISSLVVLVVIIAFGCTSEVVAGIIRFLMYLWKLSFDIRSKTS